MSFLLEKPYEFLVSTLGQYVLDTWRQGLPIERDLEDLRGALSSGHKMIRRTECWRLNPEVDKNLPRLKNAVYEAENIVDELEYQCLKQKVEKSGPGDILTDYFKKWINGFPERVKEVRENLSKCCNEMKEICTEEKIPENDNEFSETARPITNRIGNLSDVCGRDKELNDVIHLLGVPNSGSGSANRKRKRENGNVRIVSIVGSGGIGKTTLAQMVCNDQKVQRYFGKLIWICISEKFYAEKLIKEIIERATKNSCEQITSLGTLQDMLEEELKSKHFLLVLDDAWSEKESDWDKLLRPMRDGLEGNAVLVTTRSKKVAEVSGKCLNSMGSVYLKGLEKNMYWNFFHHCAFDSEGEQNYPELEKIGKEICKKLKGSPLAAKTIGGLLKINLNVRHWSNVRDSKLWRLKQGEYDIMPVLQLSYQYLPSHLKKCFSFCSLYPKDYKFSKAEIFKFWIIHGFICCQENPQQTQDVLAEVYFNELVNRCFFQQAAKGGSDKYVIHDLLHDVCQSVTKDECYCLEDEDFGEKISLDIRHLSVFRKGLSQEKQKELIRYKKLLSLSIVGHSCSGSTLLENLFSHLSSIRSLSLVKWKFSKLHESIGNIKHLQYLDISYSHICKLPDSICTLYSLKYLNMKGCWGKLHFPERSDKLVSLQIFYAPVHIALNGSVMNIADKIVTEELKVDILDHHGMLSLKRIRLAGTLTIKFFWNVPDKAAAEELGLKTMSAINKLVLLEPKEELFEGLCPHPNLRELKIQSYKGINLSPSWLNEEFLPNLTVLDIACIYSQDCFIPQLPSCIKLRIQFCDMLRNLENSVGPEHLPNLKHLEVMNCEELTSLAVESFGGFRYLEELSLNVLPKLTCPNEIVLPPSLKRLFLGSCGDLENSIPSCLENLISLEILHLSEFPHFTSIPAEVITNSLTSLSSLEIEHCKRLRSLGGLQFLDSLKELKIIHCPLLEETGGRNINGKLPSELRANLPSSSQNERRSTRARNRNGRRSTRSDMDHSRMDDRTYSMYEVLQPYKPKVKEEIAESPLDDKFQNGKAFMSEKEIEYMGGNMKRFHDWYLAASELGLNHVCAKADSDVFNSNTATIVVTFSDMWELFRCKRLNVEFLRLWCLMQHHNTTKNEHSRKVGHLDPLRVAEINFKKVYSEGNASPNNFLNQKRDEGKAKDKVIEYIKSTFMRFQEKDYIQTAYHFGNHFICLSISPKKGKILVLDSLPFSAEDRHTIPDQYRDFIDIIQSAYNWYIKDGGEHNPRRKEKMIFTTFPWCHKQPEGSNLCGYYVCEHLRINGRYLVHSEDHDMFHTQGQMETTVIKQIQDDICHFLMREVIHQDGSFYDGLSRMAAEDEKGDKFWALTKWHES